MRTMSRHDLKATVTVCAVIAVMAAPTVHAQTPQSPDGVTPQTTAFDLPPAESVRGLEGTALRIRDWRVNPTDQRTSLTVQGPIRSFPRLSRPRERQKRSPAYRSAQRILGGVALGIVGFMAALGAVLIR